MHLRLYATARHAWIILSCDLLFPYIWPKKIPLPQSINDYRLRHDSTSVCPGLCVTAAAPNTAPNSFDHLSRKGQCCGVNKTNRPVSGMTSQLFLSNLEGHHPRTLSEPYNATINTATNFLSFQSINIFLYTRIVAV